MKYELTYFDARGRAEISRLIFAAANVEYKDTRVTDWPAGKDQTPLGQLPFLTIDGNLRIPQSIAIARFLAREFRLDGSDLISQARCDGVVDTCLDFQKDFFTKVFRVKDEEKEHASREFFGGAALDHCAKLERLIGMYGSSGYSAGNSFTWADLMIYDLTSTAAQMDRNFLGNFPGIQGVRRSVESNQRIAKYLQNRKPTKM